jgi:pectate lyase
MRAWKILGLLVICSLLIMAPNSTAAAIESRDLGRETLGANDGWGAYGAGVTGGSAAAPEQVYTVHNRWELIAALNNGVYIPNASNPSNEPKIIYVDGVIDANVDDNNLPLACEDYYRDGFTMEAFLAAYDPAVWGRTAPIGPLEAARLTSRNAQQERVRVRVGSNTTIVGVGQKAVIRGMWLDLRGSASTPRKNIIIRNITFQDTYDCFPEWSPTDGVLGSWNALYDAISLRNTENVWVDHNQFEDLDTRDESLPLYFGVLFQVHDGLLDITNASDFVTVSWNRFQNHDKLMLIGSSDSASADRGKLRVTLHHNYFSGIGQRAPRVRFGQVHVFNNLYKIVNNAHYVYTWGVGIESQIYAENNAVITDQSITPDQLITVFKGTMIYASGTLVNGTEGGLVVDVVAAYNEVNDPDLTPSVGWTPTLFTEVEPIHRVIPSVMSKAGPFEW